MRSWSVYARLPRVSNKLNTKASGVVALAVMCSRVLGLIREMLFAGLFGTNLMGIFTIAFRAPNLLRDLFAEGALSTAFITVFSKRSNARRPVRMGTGGQDDDSGGNLHEHCQHSGGYLCRSIYLDYWPPDLTRPTGT